MKYDHHNAANLAAKLRPFVQKQRNTCFSEIEGLLKEILEFLEVETDSRVARAVGQDPSIANQLSLPFDNLPLIPGEFRYQL